MRTKDGYKKGYVDAVEYFEKKHGPYTFASYMRSARTGLDKSQVQMAKYLGISKSTLCDIEKGRQLVSPSLAAKIAKKCQLSIKLAVVASLEDQIRKANLDFKLDLIETKKRA